MDGGSSDRSVEIIEKYAPWLTYWESQADAGQADAIYRGFEMATTDYIGWVNSDDLLLPGALIRFGSFLSTHTDTELLVGGGVNIDMSSLVLQSKWGMFDYYYTRKSVSFRKMLMMKGFDFKQPASVFSRKAFLEVGGFERSLRFCFDFDLYLHLTRRKSGSTIQPIVAAFRLHEKSKTSTMQDVRAAELSAILQRFGLTDYPAVYQWINRFYYRIGGVIGHKIRLLGSLVRGKGGMDAQGLAGLKKAYGGYK